ncbi:hypothetical protein ACMGEE_16070 [Erwinia sp. DT-104]|uniref:phage tail fiber protein n=1 Tax=unclassified Erwinia TaxID=2622719 RepID=UPI00352154DD
MAKNDFKPFATGESANVLSQADYEALDATANGFQTGIARSEQLNKVWRQASTIASVVASFMADKSGNDVLDDGDTAALQATLLKALLNNATAQLDGRYLQTGKNLADVNNVAQARGNLGLGSLALKNGLSAAEVGAFPVTGGEIKGEVWSNSVDNYRIIANNKGVFWRFDGENYYLMLTKDGDPRGGWNNLRPLAVNYASGDLRTERNFSANGRISSAQDILSMSSVYAGNGASQLASDGNVYGSRWGGWLYDWASGQLNSRVSSFRLAGWGSATNNNNDNTFANAPDGTVVVGVQQKTNYTAVNYRYPQILINGNWYNVGVA